MELFDAKIDFFVFTLILTDITVFVAMCCNVTLFLKWLREKLRLVKSFTSRKGSPKNSNYLIRERKHTLQLHI